MAETGEGRASPRPAPADGVIGTNPDGSVERLHFDPLTFDYAIQTSADVEPTIERNKALYNDDRRGYSPSKEWQHVASIPPTIQLVWFQKYGIKAWEKDHWKAVIRLLNDPEWRLLRTAPGRL